MLLNPRLILKPCPCPPRFLTVPPPQFLASSRLMNAPTFDHQPREPRAALSRSSHRTSSVRGRTPKT